MTISELTLRRLSIAKYMYIRGLSSSKRKSITDSIQVILNFDYSAETVIKAALLHKSHKLEVKGKYKDFPTLAEELNELLRMNNC